MRGVERIRQDHEERRIWRLERKVEAQAKEISDLRVDLSLERAVTATSGRICHDAIRRVGLSEQAWGRLIPDVMAEEIERLRAEIARLEAERAAG